MALLNRNGIDAGKLAADHARAAEQRDAAIERAQEQYEIARANVIDRGARRVSEIAILQHELEREHAALSAVLADVQ